MSILAALVLTHALVFAHPNCLADVIAPHIFKRDFSYENAADWGKEFPTCRVVPGNYQSPLDFGTDLITKPPHKLVWPDQMAATVFKSTGHTLQVDVPPSSGFYLDNANVRFTMAQFHLHAPSEHTEFGKAYDLEAHFVHVSADGQIAVQGVWFKESKTESSFIASVLAKGLPPSINSTIALASIDFSMLTAGLKNASSWAYLGSLTTPPCTGNVRWTVSKTIQPISASQLQMLTSSPELHHNNRPVTNRAATANETAAGVPIYHSSALSPSAGMLLFAIWILTV
ncbi:hypothetical protein HDU91_007499 [Kappamyces sp. JEL0680]|nr:hypothetical protein HDU91_007499 [Kappamyces sp. JEL0680]